VQKFARVVLVHAARHADELTYRDEIAAIGHARPGVFSYVPMTSREAAPGALTGRIPAAIADGRLEARAGVPLTAANAHAMLCGNPAMIDDAQLALAARGMRRHRRREPGTSPSSPTGRPAGPRAGSPRFLPNPGGRGDTSPCRCAAGGKPPPARRAHHP
jgi:ferredoxin-NADP reductase